MVSLKPQPQNTSYSLSYIIYFYFIIIDRVITTQPNIPDFVTILC